MSQYKPSRNIIEGIVIGVTVAVLLGGFQLVVESLEERQQKRYIREIIIVAHNTMLDASDTTVSGVTASADEIRHVIFLEMHSTVSLAVDAADAIPHKAKVAIETALWSLKILIDALPVVTPGAQEELFSALVAVEWLGLEGRL